MKKYTLYKFPSLNINPKQFRTYFGAWIYATFHCAGICELKDNKTGKYRAYWA